MNNQEPIHLNIGNKKFLISDINLDDNGVLSYMAVSNEGKLTPIDEENINGFFQNLINNIVLNHTEEGIHGADGREDSNQESNS